MTNEKKKTKGVRKSMSKLLLGVVVGGAVGSVVGMTLAPKSGKETRKIITDRGREAWDKVSSATKHQIDQNLEGPKQKKRGFWHLMNRIFFGKKKK